MGTGSGLLNYREGPFNYQNITETIHEHYIELGVVLNDYDLFWTVRLNEGKEGLCQCLDSHAKRTAQ